MHSFAQFFSIFCGFTQLDFFRERYQKIIFIGKTPYLENLFKKVEENIAGYFSGTNHYSL